MPCDTIKPTLLLDTNFKIIETTREDWISNLPHFPLADAVFCYTDGSLKEGRAGAGIFCRDLELSLSYSLGRFCTVFMAEVFALLMCTIELLKRNIYDKTIYLCSDSQSAIKSLAGPTVASSLVGECRLALTKLGRSNIIYVAWVPGHAGVDGNERADELANLGSDNDYIGPEPVIGVSFSTLYNKIEKWCTSAHYEYWINNPGHLITKKLDILNNSNISKELWLLNRNQMRSAISLLTGHCPLNSHYFKIGVIDSPICQSCDLFLEETVEHFLFDCPAYLKTRFLLFQHKFNSLKDLKYTTLKTILLYAERTKRFSTNTLLYYRQT